MKTFYQEFASLPIARAFQRGKTSKGHNTRVLHTLRTKPWIVMWSSGYIDPASASRAPEQK